MHWSLTDFNLLLEWWTMVDRQIQVEPGIKTDEFSIVQAEDIFDKYGTHTHTYTYDIYT